MNQQDQQKHYVVSWTMDIYAKNPKEAAEKARQEQLERGTSAQVFEVIEKGGDGQAVSVDLWVEPEEIGSIDEFIEAAKMHGNEAKEVPNTHVDGLQILTTGTDRDGYTVSCFHDDRFAVIEFRDPAEWVDFCRTYNIPAEA